MKTLLGIVLFSFFLLDVRSSVADPQADKAKSDPEMNKIIAVADEIQLDKKHAKVFWELYANYQKDLRSIAEKRGRLLEDAERLGPELTDPQATELIRRALGIEEQRLAAKRRNVSLFLAKLPPRTVARYFQLENKTQTQIDAQLADQVPLVGR